MKRKQKTQVPPPLLDIKNAETVLVEFLNELDDNNLPVLGIGFKAWMEEWQLDTINSTIERAEPAKLQWPTNLQVQQASEKMRRDLAEHAEFQEVLVRILAHGSWTNMSTQLRNMEEFGVANLSRSQRGAIRRSRRNGDVVAPPPASKRPKTSGNKSNPAEEEGFLMLLGERNKKEADSTGMDSLDSGTETEADEEDNKEDHRAVGDTLASKVNGAQGSSTNPDWNGLITSRDEEIALLRRQLDDLTRQGAPPQLKQNPVPSGEDRERREDSQDESNEAEDRLIAVKNGQIEAEILEDGDLPDGGEDEGRQDEADGAQDRLHQNRANRAEDGAHLNEANGLEYGGHQNGAGGAENGGFGGQDEDNGEENGPNDRQVGGNGEPGAGPVVQDRVVADHVRVEIGAEDHGLNGAIRPNGEQNQPPVPRQADDPEQAPLVSEDEPVWCKIRRMPFPLPTGNYVIPQDIKDAAPRSNIARFTNFILPKSFTWHTLSKHSLFGKRMTVNGVEVPTRPGLDVDKMNAIMNLLCDRFSAKKALSFQSEFGTVGRNKLKHAQAVHKKLRAKNLCRQCRLEQEGERN